MRRKTTLAILTAIQPLFTRKQITIHQSPLVSLTGDVKGCGFY